jgi:hypothetical protein
MCLLFSNTGAWLVESVLTLERRGAYWSDILYQWTCIDIVSDEFNQRHILSILMSYLIWELLKLRGLVLSISAGEQENSPPASFMPHSFYLYTKSTNDQVNKLTHHETRQYCSCRFRVRLHIISSIAMSRDELSHPTYKHIVVRPILTSIKYIYTN